MTWNYAYTPRIWPSLVMLLFLLAMFFYCSRRRSVPGVLPFMAGCLFGVSWNFVGDNLNEWLNPLKYA